MGLGEGSGQGNGGHGENISFIFFRRESCRTLESLSRVKFSSTSFRFSSFSFKCQWNVQALAKSFFKQDLESVTCGILQDFLLTRISKMVLQVLAR